MFGGATFTLFHVRGIRVSVDWSWFLILFLLVFWMSDLYGNLLDQPAYATEPFLLAVATAVGFFGAIVLHELGHAIVALRNGIGILSIQLWIFGGMARMDRETESPGTEARVALGGPAVTLAIIVVLAAAGTLMSSWAEFVDAAIGRNAVGGSGILAMVGWLATINLLILVFNMIPAFPMDGGRVARAIAWRKTGDRNTATRFAANLGRVLAYGIMAVGLGLIFVGEIFVGAWLAMIGMVISGSARAAAMQTAVGSKISSVRVADVMDREPVAIPGDISVERALDEYFLRYRWPWFPVVDAAQGFLGLIDRDRADGVPEVSRANSSVADLIAPDQSTFVRDDAPLDSLLANQNLRTLGALIAVDADGRLSGVITIEQVGRALKDATGGSR